MLGFESQKRLFELIGKTLDKKLKCLVIGGSAMLFYSFTKTVTKDVDLVVASENDRKTLAKTLERIGFKSKVVLPKKGDPVRLESNDTVLDLFSGYIFRIKVSEGILSRVTERIEFGNLIVKVASPEDIILSKSMTDRMGDREDAASIIKEKNVDWNAIIDEVEWQSMNNPNVAFGVYLFDFLDDLVHDLKADVPRNAIKRVTEIYEGLLDRTHKKK